VQPRDQLYDIMKRSMYNLEYIEKNKGIMGPYETTQLLNTFLSAVAHPWERYRQELDRLSLSDSHKMGWPKVLKANASDIEPHSLGDLIRLIRNGMAHGNITLYPDKNDEIGSVFIWNIRSNGKINWSAHLDVETLKTFIIKFVALAEKLHETNSGARGDSA
jgi:hypothetical protein